MSQPPGLRISTVVFITKADAILLVKQNYGRQYWSLPGGVIEAGESVEQAAIREVKEETCLDILIKRVIAIYSKPAQASIAISLEGEFIGGELRADHEILECAFFQPDDLPIPVRAHLHQRISDFRLNQTSTILSTEVDSPGSL
jgi:argininosuccinate lyase/8-oxo-dGTP diphosphatase